MTRPNTLKRITTLFLSLVLIVAFVPIALFSDRTYAAENNNIEQIVSGMTLDEKISQMIIPAIRNWNGDNIQNLEDFPEVASALKNHQYGGIILFGDNIADSGQTAKLVYDLQKNNSEIDATSNIPYLMPVDEEGGKGGFLSRRDDDEDVGNPGLHENRQRVID